MDNQRSKTIEALKVIAHQWRQPLNLINMEAIHLSVQANLNESVSAKSVLESTQRIEMQVQRMSQVLKAILHLGNQQRYKKLFSINSLFQSINNAFAKDDANNNVALHIKYLQEDKQIFGFETDLHEVLLNLINNAKDAYKEQEQEQVQKNIYLQSFFDDKYFTFEVKDDAGGIPEPIAAKVFEQNFSTKMTGEGFGIGLYIAKLLVENEFNGTIQFETTSQGTDFIVMIPRNDVSTLKFIY